MAPPSPYDLWTAAGHGPERLGSSGPSVMLWAGASGVSKEDAPWGGGGRVRRPTGTARDHLRVTGDPVRRRELLLLLGGEITAPRALRAQQAAMPVIGFLSSVSPGPLAPS